MTYADPRAVQEIVLLAGGTIVGRTKLQKCACALELTGLGYGFPFTYKHFGPYSEDLKLACNDADALGLVCEQRRRANWGGEYSVFVAHGDHVDEDDSKRASRQALLKKMIEADSVTLELAITAAYLAAKSVRTPWEVVQERKEDKATPRALERARALYRDLLKVRTPVSLPEIV
ncbi:MAG TPA: hypothetical protein VMH86_09855 [Rhizomicrobium sp.]|nr:hypothetical protein [Rhizomicrobium sp.]